MTRYRRFEVLWVAHLFVGEIRQADDIEQLPRLRLRRPLLPSKTGHAEKGLGEAGAEARVVSDEHVLQHGHPTEQLGVLKAAGHAEAGEGVRRAPPSSCPNRVTLPELAW